MSHEHDKRIVRQCLAGDTELFGTLVERYQIQLFNAALKFVQNYDDAVEITQSVFVKAFEKLHTYDPKFRFFSWIYRMIINESLNFVNRKKHFEELSPAFVSEAKTPLESFQDAELNDFVQDAIMKLEIDYRAVIVLRHFGDLSYKDMSYVLDLPEKTVKSRLFTARSMLRDILITKGISKS